MSPPLSPAYPSATHSYAAPRAQLSVDVRLRSLSPRAGSIGQLGPQVPRRVRLSKRAVDRSPSDDVGPSSPGRAEHADGVMRWAPRLEKGTEGGQQLARPSTTTSPYPPFPTSVSTNPSSLNHVCPVLHRRPRQGGRRHLHRVRRQGCVGRPPLAPLLASRRSLTFARARWLPLTSGLVATGGALALSLSTRRAAAGASCRTAMLTPSLPLPSTCPDLFPFRCRGCPRQGA